MTDPRRRLHHARVICQENGAHTAYISADLEPPCPDYNLNSILPMFSISRCTMARSNRTLLPFCHGAMQQHGGLPNVPITLGETSCSCMVISHTKAGAVDQNPHAPHAPHARTCPLHATSRHGWQSGESGQKNWSELLKISSVTCSASAISQAGLSGSANMVLMGQGACLMGHTLICGAEQAMTHDPCVPYDWCHSKLTGSGFKLPLLALPHPKTGRCQVNNGNWKSLGIVRKHVLAFRVHAIRIPNQGHIPRPELCLQSDHSAVYVKHTGPCSAAPAIPPSATTVWQPEASMPACA